MFLAILIALIAIIALLVLHEFGHFILAKKFGVKVEEFGIGYPPRIFGKKIGETIYSLNLLPFGAFVRIPGEIRQSEDPRSFALQSVWKRILIVLGGVVSFWLIAILLFSIVFSLGARVAIDDEARNLVNPEVQIAGIAANSPAETAGLEVGDTIALLKLKTKNEKLKITKVKEVQEFANQHKGEKITLIIERGKEVFEVNLVPRVSPPIGEGAMGVSLVRTAIKSYAWYQSPFEGTKAAFNLTLGVIQGWAGALTNISRGQPSGVQLVGPVGIFHLMTQASRLGATYFLQFIGMISIYLALFNILPIPAVDGGKLVFLLAEAVRRKPVSEKIEQNITAVFFTLLIALAVWVTIKDIGRIF